MSETLKKVFISVIVLVLIGAAVYFIYDTIKASPKKASLLVEPNKVLDPEQWTFSARYPSSYQGSLSLMNKVYDNTMRYRALQDPDNPESFFAWGSSDCDGSLRDEVYTRVVELVHNSYMKDITEDMIHCAVHFIISTKYWLIFSQLVKDDQITILNGIFNQYCKSAVAPAPKPGPNQGPNPGPATSGPTREDVSNLVDLVSNGKYNKKIVDCAISFLMKPVVGKDANGTVVDPAISWLSFKRLDRGDQIKFLAGVVSEHCPSGCATGNC